MSRAKSRQNAEVCGDCGALDATWASINKGILLCTQCCSVHRALGKHISHVKNLLKSQWNPTQLSMISSLNNNGANNIWEHSLLENGSKLIKKKPNPKDSLKTKRDFIMAKHKDCAFAFRENYEDGLLSVENELGKQLHASVRTPNLETSFRLLALGADPNFFHDEKGSTPLHVATKSDQKLQAELLLVYGADPSCPDAQGKSAIDYAKKLTSKDLYNRLIENQYEVTDTFSHYLSMQKPDHATEIHFHIPSSGFQSNSNSLAKLQKLPNHVFEELAMDVFDEVDRRETEAIWLSCADTTNLNGIPFLPVDSTLSTTRNQGRQKLARFSTPELKSLVFDILLDAQRRQSTDRGVSKLHLIDLQDDDPLYDSVASDDDYALPPSESSIDTSPPDKRQPEDTKSINSMETRMKTHYALEQLTKALKASDTTITNLRNEVVKLQQSVKTLETENNGLRLQVAQNSISTRIKEEVNGDNSVANLRNNFDSGLVNKSEDEVDLRNSKKFQRPTSMYETREGINKTSNWHAMKNELKQNSEPNSRMATQSLYTTSENRETVLKCAENITRSIQKLVAVIEKPEKDNCSDSADGVRLALAKLASNLPKGADSEIITAMIKKSSELKDECFALQQANAINNVKMFDRAYINIREISFHLAKFTRDIIQKYSQSN